MAEGLFRERGLRPMVIPCCEFSFTKLGGD
jgi:hypothetical protein